MKKPTPLLNLTGNESRVVVGIAEFAASNNPQVILSTYSLGSCVGIAIYDPYIRAGGLLHCMLPSSSLDPVKAQARPGMFVDTGLPLLIKKMEELRAERWRFRIYVVGGAQIMDTTDFFAIGKRNYEAVTQALAKENLQIEAEEVGGLVNRTMHLNVATGALSLKVSGQAKDFPLCKS